MWWGVTYQSVETCNVGIGKELRCNLTIRVGAKLLLATAKRYARGRVSVSHQHDTSRTTKLDEIADLDQQGRCLPRCRQCEILCHDETGGALVTGAVECL